MRRRQVRAADGVRGRRLGESDSGGEESDEECERRDGQSGGSGLSGVESVHRRPC